LRCTGSDLALSHMRFSFDQNNSHLVIALGSYGSSYNRRDRLDLLSDGLHPMYYFPSNRVYDSSRFNDSPIFGAVRPLNFVSLSLRTKRRRQPLHGRLFLNHGTSPINLTEALPPICRFNPRNGPGTEGVSDWQRNSAKASTLGSIQSLEAGRGEAWTTGRGAKTWTLMLRKIILFPLPVTSLNCV